MLLKFGFVFVLCTTSLADDKKWVWSNSRSANYNRGPRYDVYEHESNYERPFASRPDLNPPRPGGLYVGHTPSNNYGQAHPHYPQPGPENGILTGPVPSWVKEGPFKNYDKCKCTEKFNCNTPGISYGHCDVGKSYCCYSSKRGEELGGPLPSRPHHSIENGVLVGPGGPVDVPVGGYDRPRPGGFGGHGGGFGLGGRGDYGPIRNKPVLVGPGGPFDRPLAGRPSGGGGYGLERSRS